MNAKSHSHQNDELIAQLEARVEELDAQLVSVQDQLAAAQDAQRRALADYQNLQRRTQEEKSFTAKVATQDLVSDLLDHLDHLSMAVEHSQDAGLEIIVTQLWNTLKDHGLQELEVLGQPFDAETMEAVEVVNPEGNVSKIVQRGYALNGVVLRVAKVIVG